MLKYCFALLLAPYFTLSAQADTCLVISEVMFYPQGSNNEFVEIYNLSETDSYNLDSFKIKYWNSTPDIIIPQSGNSFLPPKSFAIIFEGDYNLADGIYNKIIPANAVVFKIADNAFGSSGMANTADRPLYLLKKNNDTVDSYTYSANNTAGFSDEKIFLNRDSASSNWKNSLVINGTPGFRNSVTHINYNIGFVSIGFSPPLIFEGGNVNISTVVKNRGLKPATNFTVRIFNDVNSDSTADKDELINEKTFASLSPNDSVIVVTQLLNLKPGRYNIIAVIEWLPDEIPEDNIKFSGFNVLVKGSSYNDIVINEIMYAPQNGEPEWIELFNRTKQKINIKKWFVGDRATNIAISERDVFINGESYIIIAKDSSVLNFHSIPVEVIKTSIPSLNNDGDAVVLRDSLGIMIDSLEYAPQWGGSNGYSLERIDPDAPSASPANWGTSIYKNKASPGIRNSLSEKDIDLKIYNFHPSQPILQINTSGQLYATIRNNGKLSSGNFSLKVYYDANNDSLPGAGELIKEILQSSLNANDSITAIINFTPTVPGTNRFISQIQCANDEDHSNNTAFTSVMVYKIEINRNNLIISEIMYAPKSPQPEWIEIYNNSAKALNLKGFHFADDADTVTITHIPFTIEAGEYAVVTSDSSIISYYPGSYKFIKAALPSLNNTGDAVIILDSLNRVIDSLVYKADWCSSTPGASLERIDKDISSTERYNWECSIDPKLATPGKKNSIAVKDIDAELLRFSAAHESILAGEQNSLTAVIYNRGKSRIGSALLNFYIDSNNDSAASQNELIKSISCGLLKPSDSLSFSVSIKSDVIGKINYIAKIEAAGDEDTINNIKCTSVNWYEYSESRNDIVLSEIMYAPVSPRPEWVELYNRTNRSIVLCNYKIANSADTVEFILKEKMLPPAGYIVISTDSSIFNYYSIPSDVIAKKLPRLNNNGDKLILLDKYNRVIDSLQYSPQWGGEDGKSLERVSYETASTEKTNWKPSANENGATPGKKNSVAPPDYDLCISGVKITPGIIHQGETISAEVCINNKGLLPNRYSLIVYTDTNLDSIPDNKIFSQNNLYLPPNDSATILISSLLTNIRSNAGLYFKIFSEQDNVPGNNSYYSFLRIIYPAKTIVINEIMYNPDSNEPEWIEFFNTSSDTINIKDWVIGDVETTPSYCRLSKKIVMQPFSYFIVARDSTIFIRHPAIAAPVIVAGIPVLNNDSDGIVLTDFGGFTQDSVYYNNSFGGKTGYSIERRSATGSSLSRENWGCSISAEKSTPGRKNSIAEKAADLGVSAIGIYPQNLSAGNSFNIEVIIKNLGALAAENFDVEFNYCADTIQSNLKLVERISYTGHLNPKDSCKITSKKLLTDAPEVFLAKARVIYYYDEDSTNNFRLLSFSTAHNKNSVIVNEIMYDPKPEMPEWIEIENISGKTINLKGWSVSDYLSTPVKGRISEKDLFLEPGEYIVIARDSSFYKFFSSIKGKTGVANFGQLNNTEDGVLLFDNKDSLISSVYYKSTWGGLNGVSLERFAVSNLSNDSSNWKSSIDIAGCTPGSANSIINIAHCKRNSLVINEIMYDPGSDNCEYIEFYNAGSDTVNIGGWFVGNRKSYSHKLSGHHFKIAPGQFFVLAADSVIFNKYVHLKSFNSIIILNTSTLNLGNTGGLIVLSDMHGNVIDSLYYYENKNNRNKSLEKVTPLADPNSAASWHSCADPLGGTPGKSNSIFSAAPPVSTSIQISPNPFSPDNDGFEDYTEIKYNLSSVISTIRVRIYDSRGRLVRTIANNQITGSSGSIIFNGFDDSGAALRMGIYIVLFEASNNTNVVETIKAAVVVARRL